MDNNNYYTRRSFANAVLRRGVSSVGWEVGERSGCRERLAAIWPGYRRRGTGRRVRERKRDGRGKILKRDRYASLSRALFLLQYSLYDCFVLLFLLPRICLLFLPLSPLPLLYTRPLVSPLGRTPPPHTGRARILYEFMLEESLHFHARIHVCACVCSAPRITRHISRLESGRNPFRPAACDLIRRPRAKESPDPLALPRLLVNFVDFPEVSPVTFSYVLSDIYFPFSRLIFIY